MREPWLGSGFADGQTCACTPRLCEHRHRRELQLNATRDKKVLFEGNALKLKILLVALLDLELGRRHSPSRSRGDQE